MEGGTEASSYALNSKLQASMFTFAKETISKAMAAFDLSSFEKDLFCITDMGCSSGANTVNAAEFVIEVVSEKLRHAGSKIPKFQVFFSDLKATDFNTLFKFLPEEQGKPYFYAAAPGSFYERLFPDSSLHFALSSTALHFLSKVPVVVNDGKLMADTPDTEAFETFKAQSHDDLCVFLSHRLQEIVPGGFLVLLIPRSLAETKGVLPAKALELAWKELIDEGLVSQQTLDSYNLPVHFRNAEDVELAVAKVKGFEVLHLDHITYTLDPEAGTSTRSAYARYFASAMRAVFRPMIAQYLGNEHLADELFKRYEARIEPPGEIISVLAILKKQDN